MSNDKIRIKVSKVVKETSDAVSIYFDGSQFPYSYESGQYLTLIADVNGEEVRRPYSLCTADGIDENPGVTVKRVHNGIMSNFLNDTIKEGAEMEIMETMGNFKYSPDTSKSRSLVLIGGGSGVTPMLSILKKALTEEPNTKVCFVYVNKNKKSTIFYQAFEDLDKAHKNFTLVHYFSDENKMEPVKKKGLSRLFSKKAKNDEFAHRINEPKLSDILKSFDVTDAEVFLCGPQGLMEVAEATLKVNFSNWTVHQEKFFSAKEEKYESQAAEGNHKVTIKLNGETHLVEVGAVKSILFEGLDKGIDMPFSCQSGLCTACMGKCTSGSVKMTENSGLTDSEVAEGYILTCTGHPQSDVVIEID
jgi:ring-1,2-phenylacetyl-CoA epoxidase subunit PaaE